MLTKSVNNRIVAALGAAILIAPQVNAATLNLVAGPPLSHSLNLVQNGSFENQASGSTQFFWATGTTLIPYDVPDNWSSLGGSGAYGDRTNTNTGHGSDVLPDGVYGLYFGNRFITSISQTPTFLANGRVQFSSTPAIVPDTAGPPGSYNPPVQLWQTVSGLNTSNTYALSFWASGEGAFWGNYGHDGIFGLDVTGFNTEYLAVPSGSSPLGASHVYEFTFVPPSSTVTIKFTNWGHFAPGYSLGWPFTVPSSELVLDDVILNDLGTVPEPSTLILLASGGAVLAALIWRRRRACAAAQWLPETQTEQKQAIQSATFVTTNQTHRYLERSQVMKTAKQLGILAVCGLLTLVAPAARAAHFSYLHPNYSQQIFTGPLTYGQEAGMAWTSGGNLLTRAGSVIIEHSLTQNTTYQGTNLHGVTATHPIAGLSSTGYGITNGKDGYIYAVTGTGLERFNPSNWAAPAQSLPGTVGGNGWGITTLMDGRIAYSDGGSPSKIYVYDPVGGTNNLIYTSAGGVQVDDIEASTNNYIALAGHSNSTMTIIKTNGAWVSTIPTPHAPDGLAFGDGIWSNSLFCNNNNGSITRFDYSPGFTSLIGSTDIATNIFVGGSTGGAYGDLASVGPDCAFYVTQYENGGSNGSTLGVGTHWDNGATTSEASIVRIALMGVGSDGLPAEICGFSSTTGHPAPEPGTIALLAIGAVALLGFVRLRKRSKA